MESYAMVRSSDVVGIGLLPRCHQEGRSHRDEGHRVEPIPCKDRDHPGKTNQADQSNRNERSVHQKENRSDLKSQNRERGRLAKLTGLGYLAVPAIDLTRQKRNGASVPPRSVLEHADPTKHQPHQEMDLATSQCEIRCYSFLPIVPTWPEGPLSASRIDDQIEQASGEKNFAWHR